jgi:hypothetical protein
VDGGFKNRRLYLNRVPNKSMPETPYEMWTCRKHILNYLHVWGCPDKSKGFRFYCPDRYIKIVETTHYFSRGWSDQGSTVPREIRLEEKRVCVPTPMVAEPFFSVHVAVTPMLQGSVVAEPVVDSPVPVAATPIVGSPMTEVDEEEELIFQEPIANHEEEQQEPPIQDVPHNEPPRRSQRARRSAISDDYEVYVNEEIQMEGDPTSFEEAMRSAHS